MGRSARPKFTCSTSEELDNFYVNSIEKWREAKGLKSLNIAGYAFGSYISAKYSLHYPKVVKNLIMLSPFGVDKKSFSSINLHIDEPGCCAKCGTGCLLGTALCICCPCTAICCCPCALCTGTYSLIGEVSKGLNELFSSIGVYTGGYHQDESTNEAIFRLSEEEQEAFAAYYKYFVKLTKANDSNDSNFKKALTEDQPIIEFIDKIVNSKINVIACFGNSEVAPPELKADLKEESDEVNEESKLSKATHSTESTTIDALLKGKEVDVHKVDSSKPLIIIGNAKGVSDVISDNIKS